jgi:hypothetical protein
MLMQGNSFPWLMISISYWHQVQQKISALMNVQLVGVVPPKNKNQINLKKNTFLWAKLRE